MLLVILFRALLMDWFVPIQLGCNDAWEELPSYWEAGYWQVIERLKVWIIFGPGAVQLFMSQNHCWISGFVMFLFWEVTVVHQPLGIGAVWCLFLPYGLPVLSWLWVGLLFPCSWEFTLDRCLTNWPLLLWCISSAEHSELWVFDNLW